MKLFLVQGFADCPEEGINQSEDGFVCAAKDEDDAIEMCRQFWTGEMGYETFEGAAIHLPHVMGSDGKHYKVSLEEVIA